MTNEQMNFPKTWEEYEQEYGFNDSEEVYTNNSRLIPSFRVKQWLDQEPKTGHWNCGDDMFEYAICSSCKHETGEAWEYAKRNFKYCPNCGAKMESEE